ncbi:hypothetical protein ACFWZ2_01210 [Streptomyces sp. NPDC059002]|uniref:hypothetical protein n=1 Tax=Streptomyces sp. NPDC059002 TaxID=3346690 RepID=UPI0036984CB2
MHDRYRVVAEPPMSPPDAPVELLGSLAAALNDLDSPCAGALDELTEDMVELAFQSIASKDRQVLLRTLGIKLAAPRRASKALCRDMLIRMKRDSQRRQCNCAARRLTSRVIQDVADTASPAVAAQDVADPVARWGEPLVRLAVLTWCQASAADARLFQWTAGSEGLGLAAGSPQWAAIQSAAERVIEETPDFNWSSLADDPAPVQRTDQEKTDVEDDDQRTEDSPLEAVASGTGATGEPSGDGDAVRAAHAMLQEDLRSARDAVRRVSECIEDGCPPAARDLELLSHLGDSFAQAEEALAGAGMPGVPRRLDDVARAVRDLMARRAQDEAGRRGLQRLLDVVGQEGGSAAVALAVAHERTRQLLARPVWETAEYEQAGALVALAEIVEMHDQPDSLAGIMTRQQQLGQVLPDCVMAAVMHTELSFPDTSAAPAPAIAPAAPAQATEQDLAPVPGPEPRPGSAAETRTESADSPADAYVPPSRDTEDTAATEALPASREPGTSGGEARDGDETGGREDEDTAGEGRDTRGEHLITGEAAAPVTKTVPAEPIGAERVESAADEDVEAAVVRLVSEGRFGLAFHLATAAERSPAEAAALRLAAAAAVMRPGSASAVRAFGEAREQWEDLSTHDSEGTELLMLPALVRAALLTGEHATGAQLKALAPRLPDGLATVAIAVADRTLSSALLMAPPMAVIADASESESVLREITRQCRELLKPQRLRFNRATHIAARWLADDGMLGAMLQAMVRSDPGAEALARQAVERLSRRSEIQTEIDRLDRELRGSSGRSLQGSGRQDLVHVVERALDCAKAWLDVTEAVQRGRTGDNDWAVREIAAMRQTILAEQGHVVAELKQVMGRSARMSTAAARAAEVSLAGLFKELDHGAQVRPEPGIDALRLIDAELLKIPLAPDARPSVPELLAAVDRTWDEALRLQEEQDAFQPAHEILELAERGALPAGEGVAFDAILHTRLTEAADKRRSVLSGRHAELVAELRRAQADGALTDDQDVHIQELLADAHPTGPSGASREVRSVRYTLDQVADLLPTYRREAANRLRARLDALPDVTADDRAQVLRHLDTDGLATAADLVYFLELGEDVPEIVSGESHLADFFPKVPNNLPEGITSQLIDCVRARGEYPSLPTLAYGDLSEDESARVVDALERWRELAATGPKERQNVNVKEMLLPALSLLGYEGKKARPLYELPRSNEYRFVEATEISINGRAWAPAFGTRILEQGEKLRILMLWGRPPARLLLSRVAQEPSGDSLLVVYFGTLDSEARRELATASIGGAPLMVVDDAALAYLAARGNRQVSAATETLLPFSGVNPYIKEKRGRIGREMFYGRDAERKSILDPDGTQIIFGGRGLGKSALLNDAGDRFAEQQPGWHHKLYLNLDHHNIGKGTALGPETIWSVLNQELTDQGVLVQPRRRAQRTKPYESVRSGIKEWLDGDSRRRLLILMDECDRFFESDVPHCTETRRLRGLCEETRGRMKVVFAGLHSVQRFTRLARNGPFSHLAQTPTVVGPLAPQFAADLLVDPMRALGFEFDDVDLVNRVLGYCSYQPFLLQMFGSRMVEVMQRKRNRAEADGPPFAIEAADVEGVESDPALRADITAAFKDTLTLDDRYNVIANVLARHARDNGLETRLSDMELRDECASWWPVGFEGLDSEGFRAYLQEMVGLGVLAPNHDGRGWHLRGPNALRMIGSAHEVETQLLSAESECRLEETVVLEGRPELSDGRPAPLTVTQVDDLLGDRSNQVRVVLGTRATGVGDVEETLRSVTGRVSGWNLPPIGRMGVFRQELRGGKPGERRVIVSDLANRAVSEEACVESLHLAHSDLPEGRGVTRAVAIIVDAGQLGVWRDLLSHPDTAGSRAVVLRRHDLSSLKSWALGGGRFDTEERLTRLLEITGGWPLLLDRAMELSRKCENHDLALGKLAEELRQRAAAQELVAAAGLTADAVVTAGYRAVVDEFGVGLADEEDIIAAIELAGLDKAEAHWAYVCLEALQVFEREGQRLRVEPVLHGCWSIG